MPRLTRNFFQRATLTVAKELLGKILVFGPHKGVITETEAYIGENDPACHAAKGLTKRTAVMYGEAGYSYVYLIYGMYYCLNIVTEAKNFPAAVLIRGLKLDSHKQPPILDGPGKLCKYLGITTLQNNLDLTTNKDFYVRSLNSQRKFNYIQTPRIGIKVGKDLPWRFKIT